MMWKSNQNRIMGSERKMLLEVFQQRPQERDGGNLFFKFAIYLETIQHASQYFDLIDIVGLASYSPPCKMLEIFAQTVARCISTTY